MAIYRTSRNIEASIIDQITALLNTAGFNVAVEKTFARIYELANNVPGVLVRVGTSAHPKVEIGEDSTMRTVQVLLDIFATGDGQRLDLKDCIIEGIRNGFKYYEYTTVGDSVDTKIQNGRLRVLTITDAPINFLADKNELDVHERHRHLITLSVSTGQVEP